MKITSTEQRRLDAFEGGQTIEEIAAAEGATIQSIKTSIWRAKAKREGTYKAPAPSTGSSKKKGFGFAEADMEKVNFIKESFKKQYKVELSDEELIARALRNLFEETYKYEQILQEKERIAKEKAEQERKEQQRRERERKQKARTRRTYGRMKFEFFTGNEETTKEIKTGLRKWSKQLHPDAQTGDAEKFKKMYAEYEYLMAR